MKPLVPPRIEQLEPRLLLSVAWEMQVPVDAPPAGDDGVVVEQDLQAGILSGGGFSSMSFGFEWERPSPEEPWTPYTPTAEQTDILIMAGHSTHQARVTLTFPNSGYEVTDWGTVSRDGNQLSVDALIYQQAGSTEGGVTTMVHDYDLGVLNEYGDYAFSFNAGEQFVESHAFTIAERQWLPYSRIGDHMGIAIITEGGTTKARVTLIFPTSGYTIQDWGTAQLEGNTFVVNMEPQTSFHARWLQAVVTLTHEYDLGAVPEGNYMFEIRAWGQLAMATGFSPANALKPVHRFWSPTLGHHFYTIDESEKAWLMENWSHVWTYEGTAFYAYAGNTHPDTSPVYRFWSSTLGSHFYTIDEGEKAWLLENHSDAWTYEGIAYYAYTQQTRPLGTRAVYRFWSGSLKGHFFTADDEEARDLRSRWSNVWTPEGIAWYTYGLQPGLGILGP